MSKRDCRSKNITGYIALNQDRNKLLLIRKNKAVLFNPQIS